MKRCFQCGEGPKECKCCPECQGTGNFYRNDEDGDFLPCDGCEGTGTKKEK
jgi:hypothetical protein